MNEKTAAKKRYLKRKKERKKERSRARVGDESVRPLKKRKVNVESDDDNGVSDDADDAQITPLDNSPIAVDSPPTRSPTPNTTLPSFPLPKLPSAPSKTDLALQGLDESLINAQIVWEGDTQDLDTINEQEGSIWKMRDRMKKRLKEMGIKELFAVQKAVLRILMPSTTTRKHLYMPFDPPIDLCVSAPTGSGKTLAYAIPIIETLAPRIVPRLRALIVLPTRDLVSQVRETMEWLARGTNLRIGVATGGSGGSGKEVDVLICTPGRLVDILDGSTLLHHLRFLVVDEADRLLSQFFQDWLARVIAAVSESPFTNDTPVANISSLHPNPLSPTFLSHSSVALPRTFFLEKEGTSVQKLLFSATITSDPGKLAALGLRDVRWVVVRGEKERHKQEGKKGVLDVVMERFDVPSTLTEHYVVCPSSYLKPLTLFYLVIKHEIKNILVFMKSTEATGRLVRLWEEFFAGGDEGAKSEKLVVKPYSSDLPAMERKSVLEKFKSGEVHVLISTDLTSRGLDIPHIQHVVSYDAPLDMRKYVHRMGRTARAGREGSGWVLLEEGGEVKHFKQMLRGAGHLESVKKIIVDEADLDGLRSRYDQLFAGEMD